MSSATIPGILCRRGFLTVIAASLTAINVVGGLPKSRADIIYVTNFGANTVSKITSNGSVSIFATAGLNQPTGLAFDVAGNLYVANRGNNTIMKFTPSGISSLFASAGLNQPGSLAFDHAG